MNKLPERLKQLRNEKGLSQQDLSSQLNVPRTTLSSWETGNRTPELLAMETLADFFSVSIDYLMGRSDYRNPIYVGELAESINKILQEDVSLADFIEKLTDRKELHIIAKKLKDLPSKSIHRLIKIIDVLEYSDDTD